MDSDGRSGRVDQVNLGPEVDLEPGIQASYQR